MAKEELLTKYSSVNVWNNVKKNNDATKNKTNFVRFALKNYTDDDIRNIVKWVNEMVPCRQNG